MSDLGNTIRNAGDWLAKHVPGFAGYVKREERRAADKLYRDYLASLLTQSRAHLSRATVTLTDQQDFDSLKKLSRIDGKLETNTDRIKLADYGYTGWFDVVQIDQEQLAKIYEYDVNLARFVDEISEHCKRLETASHEEIGSILTQLSLSIDSLEAKLKERDNLFSTGINRGE
ncbi:hypothetical protein JXA84_00660 [candidate division WOR-3 bacterium]|nr:hypothetical protein [candidate division WOR-3 bacterium]